MVIWISRAVKVNRFIGLLGYYGIMVSNILRAHRVARVTKVIRIKVRHCTVDHAIQLKVEPKQI
jgi:hypothetical protein